MSYRLLRVFSAAALLFALSSGIAPAQQPAPVWDIVSIKPHKPGDDNVSENMTPATFTGRNVTFKMLISQAYDVKQWLIFGLPSWANDQHWDIEAKVSEPDMKQLRNLTREERQAMMIALLKDHVGLVAHKESKVQPVFEMTVLPEGAKFKEVPAPPISENGEKPKPNSGMSTNNGSIVGKGVTMAGLADALSYEVERNIVDRTGLTADYGYNIDLHWTPEERDKGNDNGTGTDAPPPFFEAVREQLGLKMTPGKAEVPTVVVDHIQPPDAN